MTEPVGAGPDARRFEVTATPAHRAALRAAGLRGWWQRPATWARLGTAVVLIAVGLALSGVPWAVVLLLALVVPASLLGLTRLRFARAMDQRLDLSWGDGTVHGTAFDDAGLVSRGPLGAVEYRLAVLRDVRRRGDVVEVRLRPRGTVLVVGELFPVEEEQRITAALARFPDVTGAS